MSAVIDNHMKLLRMDSVDNYEMENIDKLRSHPFSSTFQDLMEVLAHNSEKVAAKKRIENARKEQPPKRSRIESETTVDPPRRSSSDSASTAQSKDEDHTKSLLNSFVGDVIRILGSDGTRLTWPKSEHYIALVHRYQSFLEGLM